MNTNLSNWIITAGGTLLLAGCITHEETVYREVPRTPVAFENDTAARVFYETMNSMPSAKSGTESRTQLEVPLVFKVKSRVVAGRNTAFNEAVARCDTNRDGKITEAEARIFAAQKGNS